MRRTTVMLVSAFLAMAWLVSTGLAPAAEEQAKQNAFEKFQAKEMSDWRTFSRGVKPAERKEKFKEYAEKMIDRFAAFRDTPEGKPFAFDADKEILMISKALIGDEAQIDKFVESRQKADYGKRLQLHLAELYAQWRQPTKAKTIVDKVLEETKEKDPKLYAEAKRVAFMVDPIGKKFPDFPEGAKDTEGKPLRIADYKGKVVLVDFWAAWCGPCMQEAPNVVKAYEKYHPKGFEIVGISLDRSRDDMNKAMKKLGITWRQYFDGKGWENEVSTAYGVRAIPAMYLIGPDGKVVSNNARGPVLHETLDKLLSKTASGF